jgi:hypothetical protein
MSIFGKAAKPRPMRSFKKVSHIIFDQKKGFVSMSVTTVFFHVVSKVLAAIGKMDILKMSIFLYKKRSPIVVK